MSNRLAAGRDTEVPFDGTEDVVRIRVPPIPPMPAEEHVISLSVRGTEEVPPKAAVQDPRAFPRGDTVTAWSAPGHV